MKKVLVSLIMLGSLMAANLYATERPENEQILENDRTIIDIIKPAVDVVIKEIIKIIQQDQKEPKDPKN